MSEQEHMKKLFSYNWATNQRLLDLAGSLDPRVLAADRGNGRRSIYELFVHLLVANHAWRAALETGQQQPKLNAADFPNVAALQAAFETEREAITNYLNSLTDEEIGAVLELKTRNSELWPIPRWRVLHHMLFHGMQHHTEIAQALTDEDASPGDIDFIYFS